MRAQTKRLLINAAIGAAASVVILVLIRVLIDPGRSTLELPIAGKNAELLEPSWLYLWAVIPYFFVVRTLSLTDVSVIQQYLSTGLRSLVVAGIAIALARPVWTTTDDKIATVVLVDVSDSVSEKQLAAAKDYVESVKKARRDQDKVYVVTFAERPRLVRSDDGEKIERHPDGGAGTNIQSAVQLAYGVFPNGYVPRMVIISDGNQTGGDLLSESYRAHEMGVRISWRQHAGDETKEVRIASMRLPDEVKVGAPFEVKLEIFSTHADKVTITLRQDEFPNPLMPRREDVELQPGTNWVKFKAQAKRAGFTTFRARIVKVGDDTEKANNYSVMTAPVKGRPRVLYVEGDAVRNAAETRYMKNALAHENIDVEVRGPRGLPSSAKALEPYDLVLVSDVPVHFMGLAQMQALESYVRNLGGGLIMAGGQDSFGSGGYMGTRIEKIMPVRFDTEKIREQPNVAIALVIDRSGSMQGAKIEAAKESARATAEVLSRNDLVGVVAFDSVATTLVRMQRASNRTRISMDIARLSARGGTNILPALQEAHQMLQGANAKVKHVILLSDGQASFSGIQAEVSDMRANKITVSSVGIGDADRSLLQMIADNGDGKLYMTDDLAQLPRIFMKETTEKKRSALVEDPVKVLVKKRVEMIEGTAVGNAPPLTGYVSTKPKPTGEVVLISDLGEPILARWRLGTGTSVAWTSDVKSRWSAQWIRWDGYPKFWAQVVRTSMRRKVYDSYDLFADVSDGRARVVVDAVDVQDRFVNRLDTTLEIIDPADSKTTRVIPMEQTAAGRYTADFAVDRYGSYMLKAVHRRGGQVVAESLGAAALPYPEEYSSTGVDPAALEHAALVTGGVNQAEPAKIFETRGDSIRYVEDLWPWLLLFIACLMILDVYLKRVRIFGYRTIQFS
jgi:Mg-chelatase subunit ChlD